MLWLGLGMLAGAWLLLWRLPEPAGWVRGGLALAGTLALLRGHWGLAGLALGAALAAASQAGALADRLPPALDGERFVVEGIVQNMPLRESRRVALELRTEAPGHLPRRLRISWYEPDALPRSGERWRFSVKLQRPRGLVNTGSGLREAWLLRQRTGATGYASGPAAGQRLAPAADGLLRLRGSAAERIREVVATPDAAGVLTAITLGFRGGLDAETREVLARTGTGHLLAISGLHVGLVAGAGGLLAGRVARRLGGRGRPVQDWAALGAALAAAAYCVLAGMPVSAQRALLMTLAGLGALVLRRGGSVATAFGAALAAVLAADPLAVLDPGLWLSFGAVATILAVVAGRRRAPGPWRAALRIQAALAVGMLACTVAWFGRVSLVAPVANLVAVPWFSFFVVPPALAGVALGWLYPPAGAAALLFAAEATEQALWLIRRVAAWPLAAHAPAEPPGLALLLAALGTAWLLLPRPAPARWLAPLLFAPMLLPQAPQVPPGGFELRVFDVGHGLSALLRTRSHALLYDTGPAWSGGDAATWSVLPALRALGVRRLDEMILSHGHADHAGGAGAVLAAYPGTPVRGGHGVEMAAGRPCRPGQSWQWDGVRFTLLHPAADFPGGTNDGSCVLLVDGPGGRALLTGDIEARGERAVLGAARHLSVDVVVAPHHGSKTSSGAALVAATRPAWVVFSTNWRNRWGFPAEPVVRRWQRAGAMPLSTERHGEVLLRFPPAGPREPVLGRSLRCRPWLDCAAGPAPPRR